MEKERTLIGKGGMGETFKVPSPDGERLVEKEFNPRLAQEVTYRLLFWRPHPYSPDNPNFPFARDAAVQRRHMASLLSKVSSSLVEVLDAKPLDVESIEKGLRMPFIEGRPVTYEDKEVLSELDEMSKFFQEMGLTDWNLRGLFKWIGWGALKLIKRGSENILVTSDTEKKAVVIDHEEGYPVPDKDWCGIRFDDVCHPTLQQGVKQNRKRIAREIGEEGLRQFETAAQIERHYWESFRDWEKSPLYKMQTVIRALKPAYLLETIDYLLEIGHISPQNAEALREEVKSLPPGYLLEQFRKVAPHLVIHNLTHLLPIPPPFDIPKHFISSGVRASYTLGAHVVENLKGVERKKHTLLVAISSLVPGIGSFAYLIDLIPTESPDLTKLALESVAYHAYRTFLDNLVNIVGKRGFSRKAVIVLEAIFERTAFLKQIITKALEEQFGKEVTTEVIEEVVDSFIKAAKSKPHITDEYEQIVVGDRMLFLKYTMDEMLELDLNTKELKRCSKKETQVIVDFIRREISLSLCRDYERILTASS